MNETNKYSQRPAARPIRQVSVNTSYNNSETKKIDHSKNFFQKYWLPLSGLALLLLIFIPLLITVVEIQIKNNTQVTEPAISSLCHDAMKKAALVPLSQVNDAEMVEAARKCKTIEDFTIALNEYPTAVGFSSITDADVKVVIEVICSKNNLLTLCKEAISSGLIPN